MTAAEAHHLTMPVSDMVLCGDGSDPARHSKHAHTHGQSGSGSVQWQTYPFIKRGRSRRQEDEIRACDRDSLARKSEAAQGQG
jgi:hypothetical protein